jgi:hypothetical protein
MMTLSSKFSLYGNFIPAEWFEHGIDSYGKQRAKEIKRPFLAETIVRLAL